MKRDKKLTIRINEDEYKKINVLKNKHDINISSLLRRAVNDEYIKTVGDDG